MQLESRSTNLYLPAYLTIKRSAIFKAVLSILQALHPCISETLRGANVHIKAPFRLAVLLPYESLICPRYLAKCVCQSLAECPPPTQGATAQP